MGRFRGGRRFPHRRRLSTQICRRGGNRRPPLGWLLQEEIGAANRAVVAPGALSVMAATVATACRNDPENAFLLFHEATLRAQLGDFPTALLIGNWILDR